MLTIIVSGPAKSGKSVMCSFIEQQIAKYWQGGIDVNVIEEQLTRGVKHSPNVRQIESTAWAIRCFGQEEATNKPQRGLRFGEEAIELMRVCEVPVAKIHALVDQIYAEPVGNAFQEIGGCGLTLAVLASAFSISADKASDDELVRVLSLPEAHFTKRNAAKNAMGRNVVQTPVQHEMSIEDEMLSTEENLAAQLQIARDLVAAYKEKFGEL